VDDLDQLTRLIRACDHAIDALRERRDAALQPLIDDLERFRADLVEQQSRL